MNANPDAPSPRPRRVLLLDLDNCPNELAIVSNDPCSFDRVVACYGQVEPRIPLSTALRLAPALESGRIELLAMTRSGKNAADFGLAFIAGRLLVEEPPTTEFVIVSRDTDLDHVVDLLERNDRHAMRLASAPQTNPQAGGDAREPGLSSDQSIVAAADEFIDAFIAARKNPPRRKQALRNMIAAFFRKDSATFVERVLQELVARGTVTFDGNERASYHLDAASAEEAASAEDDAYRGDLSAINEIPF